MNNVSLIGRLTADPEIRATQSGTTIASLTLAVDRRYKTEDGPSADFIRCMAFGKTAEFIEKYFRKGARMAVTGRIQTGSYTNKDGAKVYTTDIVIETTEFCESKRQEEPAPDTGFMDIPAGVAEELPFV